MTSTRTAMQWCSMCVEQVCDKNMAVLHGSAGRYAHDACLTCVAQWCLTQMETNPFAKHIKCMYFSCRDHMDDSVVRRALADADSKGLTQDRKSDKVDEKGVSMGHKFELYNSGVMDVPGVFACPKQGCPTIGFADPPSEPRLTLFGWLSSWVFGRRQGHGRNRQLAYCDRCKKCWPLAPASNSVVAETATAIWKQTKCMDCPKCKIPTHRYEGCPDMKCPRCLARWCYNCGKESPCPCISGFTSRVTHVRFSVHHVPWIAAGLAIVGLAALRAHNLRARSLSLLHSK